MKLQINARGAWRDVAEFEPEQLRQVKEATVILAQALTVGSKRDIDHSFRIIATVARSPKVAAYLSGPKFKWRPQ